MAQEAYPGAGGDAMGSGGSASYSVGQVFYLANTGTDEYSVAEGVQQAYEISVVTGFDDNSSIELSCKVYPNPTTDILILEVIGHDSKKMSYQLFNLSGAIMQGKKMYDAKTDISMASYVRGAYFLKVIYDQKEIKTFKIIKN